MLAEYVKIFLIAALSIACIVLAVLKLKQRKNISRLADSINDFITNGKSIDLSVKDNEFSRLQNGISDLQNLVSLEKSNSFNQTKKNTEFISDISHQLKTPLAALRLYCEMENAENPNGHTEKELQLIEKMENLVQNLLKLEKIKSDAYIMDFQLNSVSDIINRMIGEFKHLFPKKNYIIKGDSELRCDKTWLSEAIGNLIKNASEHTPEDGTVEVTIESTQNSTLIQIQDNGGGIDEKEIPELFTRFYKSENALPTSAGIGLSITKAIVEKHHGIISAENKNNGFSVTMCFPHLDGYQAI